MVAGWPLINLLRMPSSGNHYHHDDIPFGSFWCLSYLRISGATISPLTQRPRGLRRTVISTPLFHWTYFTRMSRTPVGDCLSLLKQHNYSLEEGIVYSQRSTTKDSSWKRPLGVTRIFLQQQVRYCKKSLIVLPASKWELSAWYI